MGIDPNKQQTTGQLGVLMLDTRFPRWPGDIGCAEGWVKPPRYRRVEGAVPAEVVVDAAALLASGWAARFEAAAHELVDAGCTVLTTSCGFLVLLQAALQQALPVPLVSSSLLQLPDLLLRERQVGVLTISAERLGEAYLLAAGVPRDRLADVIVEGVAPHGEFASAILGNRETMDRGAAAADVVAAGLHLHRGAPQLRTMVLECTNLPPHADALRRATGLDLRWLRHDPRLAMLHTP